MNRISWLGTLIFLLIFSTLILAKFGDFRNSDGMFCRLSNLLNDNNHLTVNSDVDIQDISIFWRGELDEERKLIFKGGKKIEKMKNIYGKNFFYIFYKDTQIGLFVHFKTNNWHTHDYVIDIPNISSLDAVNIKVVGPDSERISKR